MLSNFHILTITHNDLNVDEIGHFMVSSSDKEETEKTLTRIKQDFKIKELVYLSTCNRVTYLCYDHNIWTRDRVQNFFKAINPDLSSEQLNKLHKFVNVYNGEDAVNHLFEVASSIDSLVVGEREIFRQFRQAYNSCREMGLTGDNLRLLEKYTVQAAKEVYANTKIGEKPLSIVSLAIQKLLHQKMSEEARLLIVGAGETNRLMAKFLVKHNYTNAVIFNRNLDNADEISQLMSSPAYHLSELGSYTQGFDILIVCTSANHALIDAVTYRNLLQKDKGRKVVIDLSVPRNVDQDVIECFDLEYIDIEQLRALAEKNLEYRRNEIKDARRILKNKLKEFASTFQQRKIERAMADVPGAINEVKNRALESVFKKDLEKLDSESLALVHEMMDYMEKKCVGIPMKLAKKAVK